MGGGVRREGSFDLDQFLPYQMNQVAEAISRAFQECYRPFGLTRTQWRVMAHLASIDGLTARTIRDRIHEDKVSVSRAVAGLEARGFIRREPIAADRRAEALHLTVSGQSLFSELARRAGAFEAELAARLGETVVAQLRKALDGIRSELGIRTN